MSHNPTNNPNNNPNPPLPIITMVSSTVADPNVPDVPLNFSSTSNKDYSHYLEFLYDDSTDYYPDIPCVCAT